MKIAKLFRTFLDTRRYLILPKIGKFEEVTSENELHQGESGKRFVRFIDDKDLKQDPEFLYYSTKNLKVDACIAESDMNCFCNATQELLIQGFEAEIPGIGFLNMESKNKLKFSGKSIYKASTQIQRKKPVAILSSNFWL